MSPEQHLWQRVVLQALDDALADNPASVENRRAKRDARLWLDHGGRNFRHVCAMTGWDPDFIRDKWKAGRIDRKLLRAARGRQKGFVSGLTNDSA